MFFLFDFFPVLFSSTLYVFADYCVSVCQYDNLQTS